MSEGDSHAEKTERPSPEQAADERSWTPPASSDQAPGEEVVQVNDAYIGGGPPPEEEPYLTDEQHKTGG